MRPSSSTSSVKGCWHGATKKSFPDTARPGSRNSPSWCRTAPQGPSNRAALPLSKAWQASQPAGSRPASAPISGWWSERHPRRADRDRDQLLGLHWCWRSGTSAHGWCGSRWRSPSERRSGCFFRYVALQILSAQHFGFGISDTLTNEISWGTWQVHFSRWLAPVAAAMEAPEPPSWLSGCSFSRPHSTCSTRPWEDPREGARIGVGVKWPILSLYARLLWITLAVVVWRL